MTCDYNRKGIEFLKSYLYLFRVAIQRVLYRKKIDIRIDPCFETGHHSDAFYEAMDKVKELEVLDNNVVSDEVSTGLADRLFAIGTIF